MALFKVLSAGVNRLVHGDFVHHRQGDVVDLDSVEADRLVELKAVAPVDENGEVTELPEPDPKSPLIEDGLEEVGGEVKPQVRESPPPAAEPEPEPDTQSGGRTSGRKQGSR